MSRRIKLLYIIKFLGAFYIYNPILSYFLREDINLKYSEISNLMGIFYFTTLIVDIPTGMIADRIGKKRALIIGYFMCCPSMLLLYTAYTYIDCLIAYIILACGITMICNSDIAFLYELTVQSDNPSIDVSKNRGYYLTATLIAGVLSSLGCSLFIKDDYRSAFFINMIIFLLCGIITIIIPSSINSRKIIESHHQKSSIREILEIESI